MLGQIAGTVLRSLLSRNSTDSPRSTPPRNGTQTRSSSGPSATREATRPARPALRGAGSSSQAAELQRRRALLDGEPSPGQLGRDATFEVDPPAAGALTITYAPQHDDAPDAGEVVWTWIPYEERDGRGKDRPVLVVAQGADDGVYVVRLTSKSHDGDRDFLSIGSGAWDSQGRGSWVDVEQLYLVYPGGMRREAAALDRTRFAAVAAALRSRYGWRVA